MGKIYVDQTHLTIKLDTETDLTNAQSVYVKYEKPFITGFTPVQGSWTATIETVAGVIKYQPLTGDLDKEGKWILWSYVIFNDSTEAAGEPAFLQVYPEGK